MDLFNCEFGFEPHDNQYTVPGMFVVVVVVTSSSCYIYVIYELVMGIDYLLFIIYYLLFIYYEPVIITWLLLSRACQFFGFS